MRSSYRADLKGFGFNTRAAIGRERKKGGKMLTAKTASLLLAGYATVLEVLRTQKISTSQAVI